MVRYVETASVGVAACQTRTVLPSSEPTRRNRVIPRIESLCGPRRLCGAILPRRFHEALSCAELRPVSRTLAVASGPFDGARVSDQTRPAGRRVAGRVP